MRLLLVAACVVVLVAGLRAASSIMIPFLVAVFIAAISLPLLTWLQQRLPMIVAVLGTILMDLLVIALAGYLVASTANQVAGEMGEIQSTLTEWIEDGGDWLEERGVPVASWLAESTADGAGDGAEAVDPASPDAGQAAADGDGDSLSLALFSRFEPGFLVDFVNRTLRATTAALSSFLVISLIVIFTLFEAATFGPKVRAAFGSAGAEDRFARAMHEIQHYMGIKTVISLATGLLIGIWVGVLGVEFAVFWGLVAFVLNFIPNLGSIIAAVPTTLLAMVQIGVGRGLLVALGYLIVNMVIGNLIEPHLMGRRLGLSTLVVVLSLVFWGWVWGPIGMLLSVPLTMVLKIMLENTEEFRWVAVLLSDSRAAKRLAPVSGGSEPDS
jgi:predicted PurR-regulated permease PerM